MDFSFSKQKSLLILFVIAQISLCSSFDECILNFKDCVKCVQTKSSITNETCMFEINALGPNCFSKCGMDETERACYTKMTECPGVTTTTTSTTSTSESPTTSSSTSSPHSTDSPQPSKKSDSLAIAVSYFGGIITAGLLATVGFFGYKFYLQRRDTMSENLV